MSRPQEQTTFNQRLVQDLRRLVAHGENGTLEFKRKASFPEKVVREMIAFANTNGGVVLIGVGDDKSLPGLKHPEDDAHVIGEAMKKCKPRLPVTEQFVNIGNGRTVIRYDVGDSDKKPHYWTGDSQPVAFVRVNDQSIRASREVREIAKRSRQKKDVRFYYGEHERFLMKYLDEHSTITLNKFIELTGLTRSYASKKFILLVLADVLIVSPHEKGDVYSLAFGKKINEK